MDSQDSSHLPHHHPHHQHHHFSQPPPQALPGVMLAPQQHLHNNSYQLPNSNNSVHSTTSAPSTNPALMHQQNPRFPFNSMAATAPTGPKPLDHVQTDGSPSGGGGSGFGVEPAKKRRGRPRKYSPDNSIGLGLSPAPISQISTGMAHNDSGGGGGAGDGGGGTPASDTPAKRNRGRPPGSVKRQLDALGTAGVGFTPHVIMVDAGEDIASKIMAFSQQGPRTVCVLSANGAISNVTLRQPAMSGGTVSYEGQFEIISLSGSFLLSESNGGNRSRTGGLSVSLAGSDGRVLGGGVAGMLKAASSVQVVVGSFIADGKKPKTRPSSVTPTNILNFSGGQGTVPSPSPGASSDSGEENQDSPLNRGGSGSFGNAGNAGQPVQNMPSMYSTMGWPNNIKMLPD